MKQFISVLLIALVLASCADSKNEMQLTGKIEGLKKGTILLERVNDSSALVSIDSVEIDGDPSFAFTKEIESPEVYYLYLRLKNGELLDDRIPFFAEASPINITSSLEEFGQQVTITGSANQDKITEYKNLMNRYTNKNLDLIKNEFEAKRDNNDSLITAIEKQREQMMRSKYFAAINFAKNNGDFEVAPYIMLTDVNDINIKLMDTVYNSLSQKIKDSKYGKELESLILKRKQ